LVERGEENTVRKTASAIAFALDLYDATVTDTIAVLGLLASGATGEPLPEVVAQGLYQGANKLTLLTDIGAVIATGIADVSSGKTGAILQDGNLDLYIGVDTLVSIGSLIAGGINPELNTSAMADTVQFGYDVVRTVGFPGYSIHIGIHFP
jgi:hypothetical protein